MQDTQTKIIAMVGFPGAQVLDIAGPLEMFAGANTIAKHKLNRATPPYATVLLAHDPGPLDMSGGLTLHAHHSFLDYDEDIDTLIVSGGDATSDAMADEDLIAFIRSNAQKVRRIVSICSGAFLLAKAGLLKDRRATTHWGACRSFAHMFPDTQLEADALFVRDDNVWTSAGVTAGMDLSLALIAEDLGRDISLAVARKNVMFMMRPGGQSQFSAHLVAQSAETPAIADLLAWVVENLDADLSVPKLAERVHMSERTFLRRFFEETKTTPAKFVELARLDAVRRTLEASSQSLGVIAGQHGFKSQETLRRVFHKHLGVSPQDYRSRFSTTL